MKNNSVGNESYKFTLLPRIFLILLAPLQWIFLISQNIVLSGIFLEPYLFRTSLILNIFIKISLRYTYSVHSHTHVSIRIIHNF